MTHSGICAFECFGLGRRPARKEYASNLGGFWRMHYLLTDDNPFTEQATKNRLRVWVTVLSGVVALALWMNLETSHPGTLAQLPSLLTSLGIAIWNMLCHFANACDAWLRDFGNQMRLL